jgi:4-amino-4-deoxy-L-arabinose transferase-like glycosyltransferase
LTALERNLPPFLGSIARKIRASTFPPKLIALWQAFSRRANPLFIVTAAWALLTVPLVFLRGYNSDEGLLVGMARAALENGYWIDPHIFNQRFAERPTLIAWIIAAVSLPFGHVDQISARLPVALFLLGGCLLIYMLLRRVGASPAATLLGVALFLACPVVLRSYVMTTADMPLAVLLFAAFVVWWIGYERGAIGIGRWLAIGGVLALASLLKGPEPIGYFAFGVGAFIVWTRSWRQIPGFVLAGIICIIPTATWYVYVFQPGDLAQWGHYMRLTSNMARLHGPLRGGLGLINDIMPLALIAVLFPFAQRSRAIPNIPPGFIKAIGCYTSVASIMVLFWPGGSAPRYFFAMILPLSVIGGLCYDAFAEKRPWLLVPGMVVMLALLTYGFVYSLVAAPLMPWQFRSTKLYGAQITKLVQAAPAPIYFTDGVGMNVFPYIPGRITNTDMHALEKIHGPAWIAVFPKDAAVLMAKRPDTLHDVLTFGRYHQWRLLRLDK